VVREIISFAQSTIDAADAAGKAAQKAGVTVEAFTEMSYAAELADVSVESLQGALTKLNLTIQSARSGDVKAIEALGQLGVNVENIKSVDQALRQIAETVRRTGEGAGTLAPALRESIGRGFADLLPLLNDGAKGFDDAAEAARKAGRVIGTDTAEAADRFNDSWKLLTDNLSKFARAIVVDVLPALSQLVEKLAVASQTGGIAALFFNEGKSGDLNAKLKDAEARLAEFLRLRQEFEKLGPIPKLFSADDLALANAGVTATQKEVAYLKELVRLRDEAAKPREQREQVRPRRDIEGERKSARDAESKQAAARRAALEDAFREEVTRNRIAAQQEQDALRDQLREEVRLVEEAEREKFELARDFAERAADAQRTQREFDSQVTEARTRKILGAYDKQLEEQQRAAEESKRSFRDLGLVFQSAFEDALVQGEKFSDVLKGIEQDLLRLAIRKGITEQLFSFLGDIFSGAGKGGGGGGFAQILGSIFGFAAGGVMTSAGPMRLGRFAGGGIATSPMLAMFGEGSRNEAFVPLPDGRNIPVKLEGGAGTVVVNMTVNTPDAGSFRRGQGQIMAELQSNLSRARGRF
jgi:hypothetical protein